MDVQGSIRLAIYQMNDRLMGDAADGVASTSIPIDLSGKEGHDYNVEIEKE
jgi:hypothetical protein